jgi:nucleoside-triphosphatase
MPLGAESSRKLLIEGRPGSGKTTAAARLVELLRERQMTVAGFLTREIRRRGTRVGFEVEALDGQRDVLAGVELTGPPRVGKYGVDLEAFERVALPAISDPDADVVVIDELGKMELASDRFCDAIRSLLEKPLPLVATVHASRHPFTDAVKSRRDVELVRLTRSVRDGLPEKLASGLAAGERR